MHNRKYKLLITIKYELKEFDFIGNEEGLVPWCVKVLTENSITPSTDVLESLLINGSYSCSRYHVSLYNMINTSGVGVSKSDIKSPSLEPSTPFVEIKLTDVISVECLDRSGYKLYGYNLYETFSVLGECELSFNSVEELIEFFKQENNFYDIYEIISIENFKLVQFNYSKAKPLINSDAYSFFSKSLELLKSE